MHISFFPGDCLNYHTVATGSASTGSSSVKLYLVKQNNMILIGAGTEIQVNSLTTSLQLYLQYFSLKLTLAYQLPPSCLPVWPSTLLKTNVGSLGIYETEFIFSLPLKLL